MSAPATVSAAQSKLDSRIAEAARDLLEGLSNESGRGEVVTIKVRRGDLANLRAQVGAWEAFVDAIEAAS